MEVIRDLAELKTRIANDGIAVQVLWGFIPGDHKGGVFYWNAESTEETNEENILAVVNTPTGRWIRL